jgi:hypothetical protein
MLPRRAALTPRHSITSTNSDRRWIGLNGPHSRIVQMNRPEAATVAIRATQTRPSARCSRSPLVRKSWTAPSSRAAMAISAWIWTTGEAWSKGLSDKLLPIRNALATRVRSRPRRAANAFFMPPGKPAAWSWMSSRPARASITRARKHGGDQAIFAIILAISAVSNALNV